MIIVGERINSTRKPIEAALAQRDSERLLHEARRQWEAGAAYLDVNTAMLRKEEAACLVWLVELIQDAIPDVKLSLDSTDPAAIERALAAQRGRPLLNSITAEQARIDAIVPLIREFKPRVIGLAMDDDGLTQDAQKRFAIGTRLIELIAAQGIALDDIFIDPLIFPVSAQPAAGIVALDIMARLKAAYPGVHTICGLSNVSFGLPLRKQINQVYMSMAMGRGLDAAILDPLDARMMANILTADMLLGQDRVCKRFLAAYRRGELNLERAATP